jgi:predicted nucleotidyltransferase
MREATLTAGISGRLATLPHVLEQDGRVIFAYLFGSAARDELTPLSDVDVAVYLDETGPLADARLDILGRVIHHLRTTEPGD